MRYRASLLLLISTVVFAETFSPNDVEILGDIDYGKTSDPLECSAKQKYCSIVFNGLSGDRVTAAVTAPGGKAFVAIADGSLKELAHGDGTASATLPEVTDKLATYYIVFRRSDDKPDRFTVRLTKSE